MLHIWRDKIRCDRGANPSLFLAIATWLFGTYHSSFPIAIYIAVCAVITLVATALRTDYIGKDISADYQSK
jgi:hypothetical protein